MRTSLLRIESVRRAARPAAAVIVAGAVLAGCTVNFNPSAIPAPGQPGGGGGYNLNLEFANVLNLPDRARVVYNGVNAGRLQGVSLEEGHAVVSITVNDDVQIPSTATATLQQDTILGDTYVALASAPGSAGTPLADGGVIPVAQTKPPTQIEDILSDLANFLGSGSLMQLQNTFMRINNNLPADPNDLSSLVQTITQTAIDLGDQSANVSQAITSVSNLVNTVNNNEEMLVALLRPTSPWFSASLDIPAASVRVLSRLSDTLAPLVFAEPLLDSSTAAVAGVLKPLMFPGWPNMDGRQANLANLEDLLKNKILPFLASGVRVNVMEMGINGGVPNEAVAEQTVNNLRMLGAVP